MRNIETINTKGETNVKSKIDVPENKAFDSAKADVIRDESKWDAFQLMGDTNGEERDYITMTPEGYARTERASQERKKFVNERLRRIGGKVAAVYNYSLR